jgi:hypothetical protein
MTNRALVLPPTKPIQTVYIAGPYTEAPELNVQLAIEAANYLMRLGLQPFVPHLCHYMHVTEPQSYERWMTYDFVWLDRSDSLLRLPGKSAGADREVARANQNGIPVFHAVAALEAALKMKGAP